jgi:quercetin dioxygenase-like cupin family protein
MLGVHGVGGSNPPVPTILSFRDPGRIVNVSKTRRKIMGAIKKQETAAGLKAQTLSVMQLVDFQPGSVVSREIISQKTGSVTIFAFDKGQGLSEHTAPFDALAYVIDGEAGVTISGERHRLTEGQMIIMPANEPHALKAQKPFKMMLVMIRS